MAGPPLRVKVVVVVGVVGVVVVVKADTHYVNWETIHTQNANIHPKTHQNISNSNTIITAIIHQPSHAQTQHTPPKKNRHQNKTKSHERCDKRILVCRTAIDV
jgi:hypothetical protein